MSSCVIKEQEKMHIFNVEYIFQSWFLLFLSFVSLFVFSPRSSFPSRSLPPHSSSSFSIFISSSLRQNKLQPKASTFQTFNATQGALSLSLSLSASMSLFRTYAQESTCLSPRLPLLVLHAGICMSLALSLPLVEGWIRQSSLGTKQ